MNAIDTSIQALESEHRQLVGQIGALTSQRDAIEQALASLRSIGKTAADPVSDVRPRQTAVPTPTLSGGRDRMVVEALRVNGGPMRPSDLAAKLGITRHTLTLWLKPLVTKKTVITTGRTHSARVALPDQPAKEAPSRAAVGRA